MNARFGSRLPRGQLVSYGLLVTLCVGMMGASGTRLARIVGDDVNFMLNPVETWVNDAADGATSYWSTLLRFNQVRTENERLQ